MISFGYKDFVTEYPNWSKHHQTISVHVMRVKNDGEIILTKNEKLRKIVMEEKDILKEKTVTLFNHITDDIYYATDYFLLLNNLDYQSANIPCYSVGAMNTKQTSHIRLKFIVESATFYLDYHYNSSGSFACSFYQIISGSSFIEDMIEEILEQKKPLEEVGITEDTEVEDYHIVAVDEYGEPIDFDISKHELFNSLVSVEIYDFEQNIIDRIELE